MGKFFGVCGGGECGHTCTARVATSITIFVPAAATPVLLYLLCERHGLQRGQVLKRSHVSGWKKQVCHVSFMLGIKTVGTVIHVLPRVVSRR